MNIGKMCQLFLHSVKNNASIINAEMLYLPFILLNFLFRSYMPTKNHPWKSPRLPFQRYNDISVFMYEVKIENIFEGPMDLLVFLIRKNEVDIYDIPIALITEQYLAYLDWMKAMSIDLAGEFLVMAATLAQIKSKMLLPVHDGDAGEADDPRMELARPLLEYLKIKSLAESLAKRQMLGEDVFVRSPDKQEIAAEYEEDALIKVGLFELIDAFQRILENLPASHFIDLSDEKISIKDRIAEIVDVLEKQGSATFDELFSADTGKSDMIVTFLAVLEMAKLCLVRITQHVQSGIIRLFYL